MTSHFRFRILGSGCSTGVPRSDGDWGACDPAEPRNARTRCSLLVQRLSPNGITTAVIDTSPDFRGQILAAGSPEINAALYTHEHADQAHGIDDLRAFFQKQGAPISCYMHEACYETLTTRFNYIFAGKRGYPAICQAVLAKPGEPIEVNGPGGALIALPFLVEHGDITALGYRLHDVGYVPDVSDLTPEAFNALRNLDVLVIDALRYRPHPTHAHLEKTLAWIAELAPRRAILTNLCGDLDYRTLAAEIPAGVEVGYDGLTF